MARQYQWSIEGSSVMNDHSQRMRIDGCKRSISRFMDYRPVSSGIRIGLHGFSVMILVVCVPRITEAGAQPGPKVQPTRASAPAPQQARAAIERALVFIQSDVAKWRKERKCATCHHGTMTIWIYEEAKHQGYTVAADTVVDTMKWAKQRILRRIDEPRDTRPGWKMVNTPAIYLAIMAQSIDRQKLASTDELKRIAEHLVRHQEADGAWAWSSAPPLNRPPPFFESDEVATRLAYMALGPQVPADPAQVSAARDSRRQAAAWLAKTNPSQSTQAAALRLLMKVRDGQAAKEIEVEAAQFLKRQNSDGGWGQLDNLTSDAYATGQALYVLNLAGVPNDRDEIQQAAAFLVDNQRLDGSWPMKSRAHPGATPYKNPMPITYFGSAWAVLGLIRSFPNSPAGAGQDQP